MPNSLKRTLSKRAVVAWALYDWANSAFATSVIAGLFPIYYRTLSAELSADAAQFWFYITLGVSGIALAVAAPLLGAIADRGGRRKSFLAAFAALGIVMCAGLAWVHAGMWQVGLVIYGIGMIGFAGANIFYDALIVEVADRREYDIVSACGYALGYIGGGLLFAVNVAMVTRPQWFGFADSGAALSAAFISVAVWWAIFSVPLLLAVREKITAKRENVLQSIRPGLAQLGKTMRALRTMPMLVLFLIAYWFYIDGVGTIFKTATFFANGILDLPQQALIGALLLTQFIAFPATLIFGALGNFFGARRMVLVGLIVYAAVVLFAWARLDSAREFYFLAATIGLVQGGVQSLSRSLYARLIPLARSAEFFGFFNLVGKFAAFVGPLLMAAVPIVIPAADARDGILALLLLFVIGGGLLWRVKV